MNDALKMQISAFVDGELPENESELLLRRLSQDPSLRQQVAEYLAIGRMIRRDPQVRGMNDLRGRIAAALGEELAQQPETAQASVSRYARPVAGVAVAASVAVLALFGLRQVDVVEPDGQTYTQPQAAAVVDSRPLADMRRQHGGSVDDLARFVAIEHNEEGLVRIAPVSRQIGDDTEADDAESDDDKQDDEAGDKAGSNRAE